MNKLLKLNRVCLGVQIPKSGYFHDKTKIFKAKLHVNDLMLKMLQKAMYLDCNVPGQVTKFNLKMQDFKRVLDLT